MNEEELDEFREETPTEPAPARNETPTSPNNERPSFLGLEPPDVIPGAEEGAQEKSLEQRLIQMDLALQEMVRDAEKQKANTELVSKQFGSLKEAILGRVQNLESRVGVLENKVESLEKKTF